MSGTDGEVSRAIGAQAPDRLAVERWIDEGGHLAPEAVIERESAAHDDALAGSDIQRRQTAGPAERGSSTADAA